jgi:serine/threonine-protein kinase HipA
MALPRLQVGASSCEYDPEFRQSGIEIAPLAMPLSDQIYTFPALPRGTFHGLPGLLADSLPDDFGNALINAWLAKEGREPGSFNPVERLCYTGDRGMGALEHALAASLQQKRHWPIVDEVNLHVGAESATGGWAALGCGRDKIIIDGLRIRRRCRGRE